MSAEPGSWTVEDARRAPSALRAALPIVDPGTDTRLGALLSEAVDHLELVLATRPVESVAALAVPVAVHHALSGVPVPAGLLASAAATYLAFDALDDQMDGDRPAVWRDRRPSEVIIGAQVLLLLAADVVVQGSPPAQANQLREGYRSMITAVAEGQLATEAPVSASTSPDEVAAAVTARSGAMLAGFAELAALATGASSGTIGKARRFGSELGVARQYVNDLSELLGDRTTDLRNGTATMTVALALQRLDGPGRVRLVERLRAAATDTGARESLLTDDLAPAIREVAVLTELHLGQARAAALFLCRTNMSDDGLTELIEFTALPGRTPSS